MAPAALLRKAARRWPGLRIDRALALVWQAAGPWTLITSLLLALQSLLLLGSLYLFKLIVETLTNLESGPDPETLWWLIAGAFALSLLNILCTALVGYGNGVQSHLVADRMQRLVQDKSIDMDLAYYENAQFYDKLHRAQREAPTRPLRIVHSLTELTRNGLTLFGATLLLLSYHWGLVLGVLLASLPLLYFRLRQAGLVYQWHRDKTASERMSAYLNQVLTGADHAREVRSFGFGPLLMKRFADLRERIRTGLQQLSAHGYRRQFVSEGMATLAGFAALAFVAQSALRQRISVGELVMYFGAFHIMLSSLRPTMSALSQLYENNLFLSALDEFLEVERQVKEPAVALPIPRPWRQGISVQEVHFRYPGTEREVLRGVNLRIGPGEVVALVGRNGSGKTTLTKLLSRLYDPDRGQILLDGTDARDFATADLRAQISVIYQDFGRYPLSARENIHLGQPGLDPRDPAIEAAARWAGIHEDLVKLPQGYDTPLGRVLEDGTDLSLGQWQKLALARAFVREAALILLDEPTSSLDAAAEYEFFERFRNLARGRAALIISHRFSTVQLADRIYVLEDGRIIEEGDHRALLARGGLYAHLFHQQAQGYRDPLEDPAA